MLNITQKMTTVLLVDDHPIVRAGFCRLLESTQEIRVIAETGDGETGCELYQTHKPDVVIMDLDMPGGIDGFEAIRRIKAKSPDAHILVFSMHTNTALIQRALELGATGYITKNCTSKNILEAVLTVKTGKAYIDPKLASNMIADSISGNIPSNPLELLTKREFQIFKLVAEGKSTEAIAALIKISPKTVRVHVCNIMEKLHLQNKTQLVLLAISCHIISADYHLSA